MDASMLRQELVRLTSAGSRRRRYVLPTVANRLDDASIKELPDVLATHN
ncbi:hypothetical protein [Arthrobacter methylotrophus]